MTYDFLDRLTATSNAYTETYAYSGIRNITSKNGNAYTNGDSLHKHAVTAVAGGSSYAYGDNGNMTTRYVTGLAHPTKNKDRARMGSTRSQGTTRYQVA